MAALHGLVIAAMLVTGVASGQTVRPDPVATATRLLDRMDAGDFQAASSDFNAQMKEALDVDKLRSVQAQLNAAGLVEGRDSPTVSERSGTTVVVIRIRRKMAAIDASVAIDSEGKIAGLHYAPARAEAAPPPPGNAAYTETGVEVGNGERALPATLALPRGNVPKAGFPAVVLVHGSGPQDRDETIGPNRPFLDIARGLAARGVAVLRYDKRTKARPQDYADGSVSIDSETTDDAVVAVQALRLQPGIDPARVFVLGHRQGGMMAPRIAMHAADAGTPVAGLVLLAAPSRKLLDILIEQNQRLAVLDDAHTSPEETAAIDTQRSQVQAIRAGGDVAASQSPLGQPAAYWRSTDAVDPVAEALAAKRQMLILQGARDIQVVDADWQGWKAAFHDDADVTFKLYPALNHLGIAGPGDGALADYQRLGNVDASLIKDVATWIDAH